MASMTITPLYFSRASSTCLAAVRKASLVGISEARLMSAQA
jgi:hypothetical protein